MDNQRKVIWCNCILQLQEFGQSQSHELIQLHELISMQKQHFPQINGSQGIITYMKQISFRLQRMKLRICAFAINTTSDSKIEWLQGQLGSSLCFTAYWLLLEDGHRKVAERTARKSHKVRRVYEAVKGAREETKLFWRSSRNEKTRDP